MWWRSTWGEEFGSFRNGGVRITAPGGNRQRVERPYTAVLHRGFSESVPNVSHIHEEKKNVMSQLKPVAASFRLYPV